MKRNNKALYESIMRSVSKEVKKALNESLRAERTIDITDPISGINELSEEIWSILGNLTNINMFNKLDNYGIDIKTSCIVVTLRSQFDKKFYDFINRIDDNVEKDIFDGQMTGYAFTTESNMVTLVFFNNAMEQDYLYKKLLKILADAVYNTNEDIKYQVYFGFFKSDENDLKIEYLMNSIIQEFKKTAYTMDDNYLAFTQIDGIDTYQRLNDIVENIPDDEE